MSFKKTIIVAFSFIFTFITVNRPIATSNEIDRVEKNVIAQVKRAVSLSNDTNVEDPNFILENAINEYQKQFNNYINITGLNVSDKEEISLENYDSAYVAPDYTDIMLTYQTNLENSLSTEELDKYEELRKQDYNFDRYVSLNAIKYRNLEVSLKYSHNIRPINPINPVTPINPIITTGGITTKSLSAAVSAIVLTLAEAGLEETAITAFTASISTMTTGLSTSCIPFVGWTLAVLLVVGALIAIAAIIVQNWDTIRNSIEEIRSWFLEQFGKFAVLIDTFFGDAIAKGNESTVAQRITVDGREREFIDVEVNTAVLTKIVDDCIKNNVVYLLGHIGDVSKPNGKHWWICYDTTTEEVVKNEKLYDKGICTYTWYNNTAKRMMANGSTSINGDYSLLIYDKVVDQNDLFGWNHYHLGYKDGSELKRIETKPMSWAHSFFGLLKMRLDNGDYENYPNY